MNGIFARAGGGRLGLISNPKSQYNRQDKLASINALVADHPEVSHGILDDFAALDEMVDCLIRDDVRVIAVNGGDGTVQAVLTALARRGADDQAPQLAILQGGMTNVIAKDVGLAGKPAKALSRLLHALGEGGDGGKVGQSALKGHERPLIGLATEPGKPPVHGMFFGAVGFYRAVLLAHDRVRPKGVAGNLASASSLAMVLARLLFGRPGADDPLYRGEALALHLDGRRGAEKPYLLLMATTLHRLMLGLMPFWGASGASIRYTSIDFPPKSLFRALLPVLRGKPRPWMTEKGYRSGAVADMTIDIESPVVLDGEIFHPRPGHPIRLTGDRRAHFLCC